MMAPQTLDHPLAAFSQTMVQAVEKAGGYTLLVDARKRLPASGIAFAPDLLLTSDHAVEREEGIRVLLPASSQQTAVLAGRDPSSDLAVLRLPPRLQPIRWNGPGFRSEIKPPSATPQNSTDLSMVGLISVRSFPSSHQSILFVFDKLRRLICACFPLAS